MYIDKKSNSYKTFLRYLENKYIIGKYNLQEILNKEYLILEPRHSDLRLYKNIISTIRKGRHGILYVKNGSLKKLSGYEALLLQVFPKEYALKVRGKMSNCNLLGKLEIR